MNVKLRDLSLLEREKLFRILRISITHHSNAMEGTTLSFDETKNLLENGTTAPNKPLSEHLVILGFAKGYDLVVREASNRDNILDSSFIKDLHYLIFEAALNTTPEYVRKPIGSYRLDEVRISGVDIKLTPPVQIKDSLENLLFQHKSNAMSLSDIANFHAHFEKIHPFSDGNGRVGRLLVHFQCIQNDLIPPLIKNEERSEYLSSLYNAQSSGNIEDLTKLFQKAQKESLKAIDRGLTPLELKMREVSQKMKQEKQQRKSKIANNKGLDR